MCNRTNYSHVFSLILDSLFSEVSPSSTQGKIIISTYSSCLNNIAMFYPICVCAAGLSVRMYICLCFAGHKPLPKPVYCLLLLDYYSLIRFTCCQRCRRYLVSCESNARSMPLLTQCTLQLLLQHPHSHRLLGVLLHPPLIVYAVAQPT